MRRAPWADPTSAVRTARSDPQWLTSPLCKLCSAPPKVPRNSSDSGPSFPSSFLSFFARVRGRNKRRWRSPSPQSSRAPAFRHGDDPSRVELSWAEPGGGQTLLSPNTPRRLWRVRKKAHGRALCPAAWRRSASAQGVGGVIYELTPRRPWLTYYSRPVGHRTRLTWGVITTHSNWPLEIKNITATNNKNIYRFQNLHVSRQGWRANGMCSSLPSRLVGFRSWMPELESGHLGDWGGPVRQARVCKCTISIHGRCFRIYMACMCDMDLR